MSILRLYLKKSIFVIRYSIIFFMILIFLINKILACEFDFTLNQDSKDLSYKIQQKEFTAFGIWTRYYAFYQDISIDKDATYYEIDQYYYQYTILQGLDNEGKIILEYIFAKKYSRHPYYILFLGERVNY